jgi:hypothetical protein
MNPIQLLKQDHRTVKGLFREFENATRTADKQKLGQEIIEELSIHSAIEEQLVYPLIRQQEAREEAVLNALEEHHAVKVILAELDGMNADHERYAAKMHVVKESVEMHIEEEEAKLLPRLDAMLGDDDDRKVLAEAMLQLKPAVPNHPHPHAPDEPPASALTGMLSLVTDAGKDVMRRLTSADKTTGHRRVQRRASAALERARGRGRARARKSKSTSARSPRKRTRKASGTRRGARKTRARRTNSARRTTNARRTNKRRTTRRSSRARR